MSELTVYGRTIKGLPATLIMIAIFLGIVGGGYAVGYRDAMDSCKESVKERL